MRRHALLGLGSVLLFGCTYWGSVPSFVVGPLQQSQPSPATFQTVVSAVRAQGYEPRSADFSSGLIVVESRAYRYSQYTIQVQCFAEGYVQVTPAGPGVIRSASRFNVPWGLQNEIGSFAQRLGEQLGGRG